MAAPTIFSPKRRAAVRQRMLALQRRSPGAPRYVIADMVEDLIERLAFLRHESVRALVIGDWTGTLGAHLRAGGAETLEVEPSMGFDEERPCAASGFDLVASVATLDTLNDLPGALIHLRAALAPGGLALASFVGAGSLDALRAALLKADGARPAARVHPMVDARAGAQLLQRAGFADPVADARTLAVRYASLDRLVGDLRAQGLTSVLASAAPPYDRSSAAAAREAFGVGTEERFEIITLTGWKR